MEMAGVAGEKRAIALDWPGVLRRLLQRFTSAAAVLWHSMCPIPGGWEAPRGYGWACAETASGAFLALPEFGVPATTCRQPMWWMYAADAGQKHPSNGSSACVVWQARRLPLSNDGFCFCRQLAPGEKP